MQLETHAQHERDATAARELFAQQEQDAVHFEQAVSGNGDSDAQPFGPAAVAAPVPDGPYGGATNAKGPPTILGKGKGSPTPATAPSQPSSG